MGYQSTIESIKNDIISGLILESFPNYGENLTFVHLGIGILKNEGMKLAIEKAVECGVAASISTINAFYK